MSFQNKIRIVSAVLLLANYFLPALFIYFSILDEDVMLPLGLSVTLPLLLLEFDQLYQPLLDGVPIFFSALLYLLSIGLCWLTLSRTFGLIRSPSVTAANRFVISVGALALFAIMLVSFDVWFIGRHWLLSSVVMVFAGLLSPVLGVPTSYKTAAGVIMYLIGYLVIPLLWAS